MNQVRCLIIDDEELARTLLENYISRLPQLTLIGQCKNPIEALSIFQNESIDLIFLDIQMPELSGLDFLKSLRQAPLTILTTAYSKYALEGYQHDVVDYLLKPFGFDRFTQAVNKAIDRHQLTSLAQQQKNNPTKAATASDYLLVKSEHKIFRIHHNDILYIQSMREYVAFYTSSGRILSLNSLKQLEQDLPAESFARIHKSYMIATKQIKSLEGNQIQLLNKEKLPIGASYKEAIIQRFF